MADWTLTPPAGTIRVFGDVMCGWATLALHRFYRARSRAGLDERVRVDHQLFLLEDVNEMALNRFVIEGEKPVVGALAEELELKPWQRDPSEYPVTSALANEAVHAAKAQSLQAAEQLDFALRLAFWRDSRCISMRHEILAIADECDAVDTDQLRAAVDDGQARGEMMGTYFGTREQVRGSPHFFLADGTDVHNPGTEIRQVGEPGAGFLVVDSDEPSVYDDLVLRAAA